MAGWPEGVEGHPAQIMTELANARVVAPLWCEESVGSEWVRMEAEFAKEKLLPARLQKVVPPGTFEAIQAADLIGWDGAVGSPRLQDFIRLVCKRLELPATVPTNLIEELAELPPIKPLPATALAMSSPPSTGPARDDAFGERQWTDHGAGSNLVVLRVIAEEASRIFAKQARARIAEIEAARQRVAEEERNAANRYQAEGRIKVEAQIVHRSAARLVQAGPWENRVV